MTEVQLRRKPTEMAVAGSESITTSATRANSMLVIVLLVTLNSIMAGLSVDLMLPALPGIQQTFSLDSIAVQQSLTCYLAAYALGCLVIGPVSDAFGRRPVLLAGLALFVLSTLIPVVTDSYIVLLLCRCLQGFGACTGKVVCRALVADRFDQAGAQKVLSLVTALYLVAPAMGPILGGLLYTNFGWRSNFAFMAISSFVTFVLYVTLLRETHDGTGIRTLHAVSMWRDTNALLRQHSFVLVAVVSGLCSAPMFLYVTSAPTIVLSHWRLDESGYGWLSIPIVAGTLLGSIVCNRLSATLDRHVLVTRALAALTAATALAILASWLAPNGYERLVVIPVALTATGSAIVFPALMVTSLSYAPSARGLASSLFNFISLGLLSVVSGLIAPIAAANAQSLALASCGFAIAATGLWANLNRAARR